MLKQIKPKRQGKVRGEFALIASQYNGKYVDAMLRAAREQFKAAQVDKVHLIRVPGAYEIPVVAAELARSGADSLAAIICLGVVFRGATTHAQNISDAVGHALAEIQIQYGIPVIHGVYLFENEDQARQRCLDPKHNRGLEVSQTALAMARVMPEVRRNWSRRK